ncbi:MAG TPA: helix-turn-helix domain-containing protein [Gammaproteobacteria bacterium]
MRKDGSFPIDVAIVAVRETAGAALYGLVDVLCATGRIWQNLVNDAPLPARFRVRIVSAQAEPFTCVPGIPVTPHAAVDDDPAARIVILPELRLGPDEPLQGRYPAVIEWIKRRYEAGAALYSACSGSVMLAEAGLLDGRAATSHWGYRDLFARWYPQVRFDPQPNLVFAEPRRRIVTAAGATSWHDLAIHIVSRHVSPAEAMRIAKVYLLKWHGEGQLPYAALVRNVPHSDAVVQTCERWLARHFREDNVVARVVAVAKIPERTLKRRFKAATGCTPMEYVQNLRVEEAKRLLETGGLAVDEISYAVGYEDASFFRRVFRRCTGLAPSEYRRLFRPLAQA